MQMPGSCKITELLCVASSYHFRNWKSTQLILGKPLLYLGSLSVWSHLILTVVLWDWCSYTEFTNLEIEAMHGNVA